MVIVKSLEKALLLAEYDKVTGKIISIFSTDYNLNLFLSF